jgi:hypothetical protein
MHDLPTLKNQMFRENTWLFKTFIFGGRFGLSGCGSVSRPATPIRIQLSEEEFMVVMLAQLISPKFL